MVNFSELSSKDIKTIKDSFPADSLKFSFEYWSDENRKGMSGRASDFKLVKGNKERKVLFLSYIVLKKA